MEQKKLTREQVEQIVSEARERGERPDLREADLRVVDLRGADLSKADLFGADLFATNLSKANLSEANLSWANLSEANLSWANLNKANLSGTRLWEADFGKTTLSEANLSWADLSWADFTETELDNTDFSNAIIRGAKFIAVDLSQVKGLIEVKHQGPSAIDINTIYQSKDKIPREFLEGAGVHPDIIRWQHSLHTRPTVFISYSHHDEKEKADLLVHLRALEREDLISVWHDELIQVGTDWKAEIKAAIAQASVAILLITPHFLASDFIRDEEIPAFLKRQESEEGLVIVPIIARPCAWSRVGWLAGLEVRPKGGQPVWGREADSEAGLAAITDEVIQLVKDRWLRKE